MHRYDYLGYTGRLEVQDETAIANVASVGDLVVPLCDKSKIPYVHQANLDYVRDSVRTVSANGSATNWTITSSATAVEALPKNNARVALYMYNTHLNKDVFGRWGDTDPLSDGSNASIVMPHEHTFAVVLLHPPKDALQVIWESVLTGTGYLLITEVSV